MICCRTFAGSEAGYWHPSCFRGVASSRRLTTRVDASLLLRYPLFRQGLVDVLLRALDGFVQRQLADDGLG